MQNRIGIFGTTLFALSAVAFSVHADDETIPAKSLPAAVKKAIQKKFSKAEIEKAVKEVEDGKTTYEVLLEIDDRPLEVAFTADGIILEIEKVIPFESAPAPVKKALAAKYPSAKIEKVEAVTKGEDGPTVYEIVIQAEVVLDSNGNFVEGKQEEDEKPSAKSKKPKKHGEEDEDDDDDDDDKGKKRKKKKDD
jgi:Putative beta-lactamase-inhibitor-like, PepSY-like